MSDASAATSGHRSEFLRFLVVGGFSAAVNFGSRILLSQYFSFGIAVLIAFCIGMTTGYVLSKRFVFAASGRKAHDEFMRFGIVNLIAVVQVWLISVGLADYLFPAIGFTWFPQAVAHALGVASPVVTSYLGHRHFSFAQSAP
jgi:putative flippase GtrA